MPTKTCKSTSRTSFGRQNIPPSPSHLVPCSIIRCRVLESIRDFALAQQKKSFLSLIFNPDDLRIQIDEHERSLISACSAFQTAALIEANRKLDGIGDQGQAHHDDLVHRLEEMKVATADPKFLEELLGTLHADVDKTMTAMQAVSPIFCSCSAKQ